MGETKEERRQNFWNIDINPYEKRILKGAGFCFPEQLLNLSVICLVHLDGFGVLYTINVLQALCIYFELPEDEYPEVVEKIMELYSSIQKTDDFYDAGPIDDETETLIVIDDIFYDRGYTDEKRISRITVRELLDIKGMNQHLISCMVEEIVKIYDKTYVVSKYKFKSIDDIKSKSDLLFETLK